AVEDRCHGASIPVEMEFTPTSRVSLAGCKNVHYDLIFLLDTSSSVGKEDFEKVRQWIAHLVDTFEIGPDKTRVGVVQYSDQPTTEFDLGSYGTQQEIKEAAKSIKYYGGNTNTGDALRYINSYSFSVQAGGRPNDNAIKKVVILLTDGRSQDYVLSPASGAHKAGIRIFAVGRAVLQATSADCRLSAIWAVQISPGSRLTQPSILPRLVK
uniref:VWFA domain-containing protein n=1 Tax=Naja naja TaxID=35670 RepID=A0A8C7E736_NAJNA